MTFHFSGPVSASSVLGSLILRRGKVPERQGWAEVCERLPSVTADLFLEDIWGSLNETISPGAKRGSILSKVTAHSMCTRLESLVT